MFEDVIGKKLLIIGADASICNIVEQAKEMGIYTIAVERGQDLEKAPAKRMADEGWNIDYSDIDTLVSKAEEAGVNGVMSGYSEGKVLFASKIAQKLGTPFYVTPEQVELTRDKRMFKTLCTKYGIPVPKEYCASGKITDKEKEDMQYPVIVKPADYGGRIGISVCHERSELDNAVEIAQKNSFSGKIVAEEYLQGTEITAIYTLADGEISLSVINDKYLSKEGNLYACLCDLAITPSRFYQLYVETVDEKIKAMLRGIGMRDGIAGFQFIATEERIVAFEMGLRLNGGNDWKLLDRCNGINQLKMLIHHAITGRMGDTLSKDNPVMREHMATYVIYAHGGTVGEVDYSGLEGHGGIIDISSYVYAGKVVPDRGTTQQRVLSVKLRAPDNKKMAELVLYVQKHVTVKDLDGNDMLFRPFDVERIR